MAKKHGKQCRVYVDEFDLSGDTASVEMAPTVDMAETTGMTLTSKTYIPGTVGTTVNCSGFWGDTATTGSEEVLTDYWEGEESAILTVCPGGVADETIVYTNAAAYLTTAPVSGAVGGAVAMNHNWQASGDMERMLVLYEGTITETTTGEAIDFGSAGVAASGAAVIHFTALAGSGTLDVKITDCATEDGEYADESGAAFTELTAIGKERDTWDGACAQYLKVVMTVSGFTSCTLIVAAKTGGTYA